MIKELVLLSGKGGTGKTTVAASFAALAEKRVVADCDVDAADLHLVINTENTTESLFEGGSKAFINPGKCTSCGKCFNLCRFEAIDVVEDLYSVNIPGCEGCGVCAEFCPALAIEMKPHLSGIWYESSTAGGPMVHARLGIAEGNSGRLVTLLRKRGKEIAEEENREIVIIDGSPGTGCPVIASVTGASFILIVTEPTVSGLHDLKRLCSLTEHFKVASGVCINRFDINEEQCGAIADFCNEKGIPLLGFIPYDRDATAAQIAGRSLVEYSSGPAAEAIRTIWGKLENEIIK